MTRLALLRQYSLLELALSYGFQGLDKWSDVERLMDVLSEEIRRDAEEQYHSLYEADTNDDDDDECGKLIEDYDIGSNKCRFTLNETSELMYHLEDELSTYMSLIEDFMVDEGSLPNCINNYTVQRLLQMIEIIEELNEKTINTAAINRGASNG